MHTSVGEAGPRLTLEVPCGISRRFASREMAIDWTDIVHGSLFDAAPFCPRCSQHEEDGDELPGETEGKQQSDFSMEILLNELFVFLPNYLKRTNTWHSLSFYSHALHALIYMHNEIFALGHRGD